MIRPVFFPHCVFSTTPWFDNFMSVSAVLTALQISLCKINLLPISLSLHTHLFFVIPFCALVVEAFGWDVQSCRHEFPVASQQPGAMCP